jgi:hypothetical protein
MDIQGHVEIVRGLIAAKAPLNVNIGGIIYFMIYENPSLPPFFLPSLLLLPRFLFPPIPSSTQPFSFPHLVAGSGHFCQESPLIFAATEGHEEIVILLLEAGADKNQTDGWDR